MASTKSAPKPTYLGLLNAISVAETAAEPLFLAWADKTNDDRLAETLRFVGMREGEHGKAFAKRMLELGYEVREQPVTDADSERMKMASSRKSDLRKFEELGLGQGQPEQDVFDPMFADKTIDPITGGLLGRYIAEERDSGRRLSEEYTRIKRAAARKKKPAKKK